MLCRALLLYCCVGIGMHLLRRRRPSATHLVIVFAVVILLQASTGVVAFVALVAAGPPVAAAASAAAPVFKTNPSGTQLASTKSIGTTTGTIARKGLTMTAQFSSSAEVIVVGSCNTDLVTYTPRLPGRGESMNTVAASILVFSCSHHVRYLPRYSSTLLMLIVTHRTRLSANGTSDTYTLIPSYEYTSQLVLRSSCDQKRHTAALLKL